MKDVTGASVVSKGNITADSVTCAISESGMGHIMSVLSNMYSNKALAVLREYSLNGWDSHVAAGNTSTPISVTLPTTLKPSLVIEDYGIGLTKDEVLSVFGTYGASTKRDSNEFVGALGIGSKSAFTLGHQFVVTAVKDGIKSVVLFALNEENLPTMRVIKEEATDKPNGVKISLAVDDIHAVVREAASFFSKWVPGRVLVDGEAPSSLWASANEINDRTHIVPSHDGAVWVEMGMATYEVPASVVRNLKVADEAVSVRDALASWYNSGAVFFHVNIGDVDIAPSREAIRDTTRTQATLVRLIEELAETLTASVQAEIDACNTLYEATAKYYELKDTYYPLILNRVSFKYKGHPITDTAAVDLPYVRLVNNSRRYNATKSVSSWENGKVTLSQVDNLLVILTDANGTVTRYAKKFLEHSQWDGIFLANGVEAASFGWFSFGTEDASITSWTLDEYLAEAKRIRKENAVSAEDRAVTYAVGDHQYHQHIYSSHKKAWSDIVSWGKPIAYAYTGRYQSNPVKTFHADALADYTMITLWGSQTPEALIRRAEEAGLEVVHKTEAIKRYLEANVTVPDSVVASVSAQRWLDEIADENEWIRIHAAASKIGEITSETMHSIVSTILLAREATTVKPTAEHLHLIATRVVEIPAWEGPEDVEPIEETYPMLSHISSYSIENDSKLAEHVLTYINAN